MKSIKFKIACNFEGKKYEKGNIYVPKKQDIYLINKLNEKGFIEPLTKEELLELSNSFLNIKKKRGKKDEL